MQSSDDRAGQRRAFRKMAKDMAGRYLSQMEVFNRRGLKNLGDLLSTVAETIPLGKREKLAQQIDSLQRRLGISASRRRDLEQEIDAYLAAGGETARIYGSRCWRCYSNAIPSASATRALRGKRQRRRAEPAADSGFRCRRWCSHPSAPQAGATSISALIALRRQFRKC